MLAAVIGNEPLKFNVFRCSRKGIISIEEGGRFEE